MRFARIFFLLLLFPLLSFSIGLSEARFLSVRYIEEAAFLRISEFFTGKENSGNRLVCRSRKSARAGLYLIVSLKESTRLLPANLVARWQVITPQSPDPVVFRIPIPNERPRGKDILLGLTGSDWPNPKARPLAWKLTLEAPDGQVVLENKSFLWERP